MILSQYLLLQKFSLDKFTGVLLFYFVPDKRILWLFQYWETQIIAYIYQVFFFILFYFSETFVILNITLLIWINITKGVW